MITVFYDGRCGLCRREIAFYRRISAPDRFSWRDVHADDLALASIRLSRAQALRALHVVDEDGKVKAGVDAFAAIWRAIPVFAPLGHLVEWPIVNPLARAAYAVFGVIRYRFHRYDRCAL